MFYSQDAHFNLTFKDGEGGNFFGETIWEDETHMDVCRVLTFKTKAAVLCFSTETVMWNRNMPTSYLQSKIY